MGVLAALGLVVVLVLATGWSGHRRWKRLSEAFIAIYGMEQVRGLTLEQARFAAVIGAIKPIVPTDEAIRILDEAR